MIPNNISKESILKAINDINHNGVPKGRQSTRYFLKYENNSYPPKYVISLANKYVNGIQLKPSEFSGGRETNNYLLNLEFKVISTRNRGIEVDE